MAFEVKYNMFACVVRFQVINWQLIMAQQPPILKHSWQYLSSNTGKKRLRYYIIHYKEINLLIVSYNEIARD